MNLEARASGTALVPSGEGAPTNSLRSASQQGDTAAVRTVLVVGTGESNASEGAFSNTGYVHHVSASTLNIIQQRTPREPAPWPHQVGVIPPRAQAFQERPEAALLRSAVEGGGTAVLHQSEQSGDIPGKVLAGMGGVGKTQLAADYARAAWDTGDLDVLVWITASTRLSVVSSYARAGRDLCRADRDDSEEAARAFVAWLTPKAGGQACRWLVVLDDLVDPDDLQGLWPPASPHGQTLVTTRRRDAALLGGGRHLIKVGVYTDTEAAEYLRASLADHNRSETTRELQALAHDLGHLPLALAQAAAYLADSGKDTEAYRSLLADRGTLLADTVPERLPDGQDDPWAAAWSLSVDRADSIRPVGLARPVLNLAAVLDANGIPQCVLTSQPVLDYLTDYRTRRHSRARRWLALLVKWCTPVRQLTTPDEVIGALRALHRLSLIDHVRAGDIEEVRVHQLIQRAVRSPFASHELTRVARVAADALLAVWPEFGRHATSVQDLRANVETLTHCADEALYQPDAHEVLYRAGRSLGDAGQVTAAVQHFERLVDTTTHRFGIDGPDTLAARGNLAYWRGRSGNVRGAIVAFEQLCIDRARVLGEYHPNTLAARGNLSRWTGEAGDVAGAVSAYEDLLLDQERELGPDHPETLTTRHNLAYWRGQSGDIAGAVEACQELLADEARVFGKDHPETLSARANLARWKGEAGDSAGAAAAFEQLLADRQRVLGNNHPETLVTRGDLARWQGEAGELSRAVGGFEALLADAIKVLGEDHPETLATRGNLARWQGENGDPAGAAAATDKLLPDMTRILGKDHPHTLTARHNLARWQGEAGDPVGAWKALQQLLADRQRVLGGNHPQTHATAHSLTEWRQRANVPDRSDRDSGDRT
ncbi:tetratricopeptide repeat protein [Streptomyces phaeofaciens]|nr:tetratricopeptide repeat protein [Streptomyces phaeofaciens]